MISNHRILTALFCVAALVLGAPASALGSEDQLEPAFNNGIAAIDKRLGEVDTLLAGVAGQASSTSHSATQLLRPRPGVRLRAQRRAAQVRARTSAVRQAANALVRKVHAIPPVTPDGTAAVGHVVAGAMHALRSADATQRALDATRAGRWRLAATYARQADTARARLRARKSWAQQRLLMARGGRLRPWQYQRAGYQPIALPPEDRPYGRSKPLSLRTYSRPLAADGTVRFESNGQLLDHPLALARYATELLESYRIKSDRRYLDRARANLERLVKVTAVRARDAEYYAYRFDYQISPDPNDLLRTPWYSAITQGRALSALLRMYEMTGEQVWRDHADRAFASFLNDRWARRPWIAFTEGGYLWLEQYPRDAAPSRVLNGHISAAIGIYEYALATGDPRAVELFDAAVTTVRRNFRRYRVPGQLSRYDLLYRRTFKNYHEAHIRQLRQLALMTGDATFKQYADLLERDQRTAGPETG